MNHPNPSGGSPLRSHFAGDPEMGELVDLFVGELPARLRAFEEAWQSHRLEELRRIAHQLRGVSANYGFPAIGRAAAAIEDGLRQCRQPTDLGLKQIQTDVDELVSLCRRAMLR